MSFQSDMASDIDTILGWSEGSVDFEYKLSSAASEWSDGHGWVSSGKSEFDRRMDGEGVASDLVISVPSTGDNALGAVIETKTLIRFDGDVYEVTSIDPSQSSGLNILYCRRWDRQRRTTRDSTAKRYM